MADRAEYEANRGGCRGVGAETRALGVGASEQERELSVSGELFVLENVKDICKSFFFFTVGIIPSQNFL